MAVIEGFVVEIEGLTRNANLVKDMVLAHMKRDGHIDQAVFDKLSVEYVVVVAKRSWFGRAWAKLVGKEDTPQYFVLKAEHREDMEEDDGQG